MVGDDMLKGKVAIVTGGTRGIGFEIVRVYLKNNAKVVLFGSREESVNNAIDLLKKDSIKKAREALKKLSKKSQEVLILKEYGDMSYKEIAKVLGITEGNVKIRVFRAREQLAKIIGEDDVYMS